jgi:hypothetical protein
MPLGECRLRRYSFLSSFKGMGRIIPIFEMAHSSVHSPRGIFIGGFK